MADITIITPVLNQVSTIEACIDSVAQQEIDVEHIIIDGGSTDGTIDVIRKHENKLAYWISEPDNGQSDAINKGLNHATGRFFNWLNADDQLKQNALKTVLTSIAPETLVVIGKCEHINQENKTIAIGSARVWNSLEGTLGNYSMGQPSLFYRTKTIKELGKLNTELHYCMDMDLWFRFLLTHGQEHIVTIEQILSRFLVHSDSKSVHSKEEMATEKYAIYNALLKNKSLPNPLILFFQPYPIPNNISYQSQQLIKWNQLFGYFTWHLMQKAYEEGNLGRCMEFFKIVQTGAILSKTDELKWNARFYASKISNR